MMREYKAWADGDDEPEDWKPARTDNPRILAVDFAELENLGADDADEMIVWVRVNNGPAQKFCVTPEVIIEWDAKEIA